MPEFEPGHQKLGGRRKGTPNRVSGPIKDAILEAFHSVGGVEYLVGLAKGKATDRATFCRMVEKLVPAELKLDPESALNLVVIRDYTGEHTDGDT